jgi:hypothetical protein
LTTPGQVPYLVLEPAETLRGNVKQPSFTQTIAQEFAPVTYVHSTFGGVHFQFEFLFQKPCYRGHDPFSRCLAVYIYITVIGITAKLVPAAFQFLVKIIKKKVGQQWRKRTSLGRSLFPANAYAVPHHARLKKSAADAQKAFILHMPGQTTHQYVVVHPVEKFLQVNVHNITPSVRHIL